MTLFENYYDKLNEEANGYIVHLESADGFKFGRSILADSEDDAKEKVTKEFPDAKILSISKPGENASDNIKRYDYQSLED